MIKLEWSDWSNWVEPLKNEDGSDRSFGFTNKKLFITKNGDELYQIGKLQVSSSIIDSFAAKINNINTVKYILDPGKYDIWDQCRFPNEIITGIYKKIGRRGIETDNVDSITKAIDCFILENGFISV